MNGYLENLKTYEEGLYQTWDCYDGPDKRLAKVVVEGDYEGRHFVIAAHHAGQPNAYIEVFPWDSVLYDEGKPLREDWRSDVLDSVHCGSTYYGSAYWDREHDNRTYIGWDYGHAYDYSAYDILGFHTDGHKWNIAEIMMDVARAAYELELSNENDNDYWDRKKEMNANR